MESKLKRRFIRIVMLSLAIVLVLLFGGINLTYFVMTTNTQDKMLKSIADNDRRFPEKPPEAMFGTSPSPEVKFMTRFFSVRLDKNGDFVMSSLDFVSSINAQDAVAYAKTVYDSERIKGYYGEYRFLTYQEDTDTVVIFLNCGRELQSVKSLLILSLGISVFCFFSMIILVSVLSKRAVAPFIKNVENQKRFITDAGHELKTPLTTIITSADVLAYDMPDNEWVVGIKTASLRLTKLIQDLVTMSRLDEEKPIPDKTIFSLSEAVWESMEPFSEIAKASGKKLETTIADDLMVYGDKVSVQQAISILLDNAMKYSDEEGAIKITAYRKKQKSYIAIFNTCEKLNLKNPECLFERFYRMDSSRSERIKGTGVGLSIARAIARAHGGDIIVESFSEKAIQFRFSMESGA